MESHSFPAVKVVMAVSALDGSFNRTFVIPKMIDFEMEESVIPPDHLRERDSMVSENIHRARSYMGFRGTALPNEETGRYATVYDNLVAQPNLDDFLLNFTKDQRIEMAKKYVKTAEAEIEKVLGELGVDILKRYLERNGFDVVPEGELED